MTFDFSAFFERLAKSIRAELMENIEKQIGVDGKTFKPLDPKTINRKHLDGAKTPEKRMIFTEDFLNRAFLYTSSKNFLEIFVSPFLHGKELRQKTKTLEKYVSKNDHKKAAQKSKEIDELSNESLTFQELAQIHNEEGKSLFFPTSTEHVNNMRSVQRSIPGFKDEVLRQTKEMFPELTKQKVVNF